MIKPLTSLRFLFSAMVFLSHSAFIVRSYPSLHWPFEQSFTEGEAGVAFFFILSGFILAKSYSSDLVSGEMSRSEFLIKRVARIYPLHLITLLLYLPYYFYLMNSNGEVIIVGRFLKHFFLNALLLHSFYPQMEIYLSFNAPVWSISAAMFFYLVFPLLVNFIFLSQKGYLLGLTLLCTVLLVFMAFIETNFSHYVFYINPLTRLLDFAIGIGLYALLKDRKLNTSALGATLIECCAIIIFITFLAFHHHVADVYRYSVYYWLPAVLIIAVVYSQKGLLSRILSSRWAVFLGNISFGVYLFHWELIRYISGINHQLSITNDASLLIAFSFLTTLMCSSVSYFYFEKPITRRVNTLFKHRYTIKGINSAYRTK